MAAAAAIMQGAGAGMQVIGSLRQAQMNSQMSEYNATVAEQNVQLVTQQANENARRALVNSNKVGGAEAAGFGASGVSGTSALAVLQDTAAKGELDALTIKQQGAIKAAGYQNEANLDQYRASNELVSGDINAMGGGMASGGKMISDYSSGRGGGMYGGGGYGNGGGY